ncbi:hypothetical protein WMF30_21190 [Sorangium sp. So ce134]
MNRACIRGSLLLAGILTAAACNDVEPEEGRELLVGTTEQAISTAVLQSRSNAIKSVHASHPYIHNPLIFAGIAYTETQMGHCYSEYYNQVSTNVCAGPYSADCGGPVTAGYWDGPCNAQGGGLGMWQFDELTYTQTLNKWTTSGYWNGQTHDILSVAGSISAAIDFVLFKAWYSSYTPYFSSYQAMYTWINSIRPVNGNADYENWLGFLANSYNGQSWGHPDWSTTKEKYRTSTAYVYTAMGGDSYWYGSPPPPPPPPPCGSSCTQCVLQQRTDVLPFYQASGWDTSCGNRNALVTNWCGIDPGGCVTVKSSSTCQASCIAQGSCGNACTACVLQQRTDILPFYQGNGWDTSCGNRNAVVTNWCSLDPSGCAAVKSGNACRAACGG